MSNKIFLDSSILIEYLKGSKTKSLDELVSNEQNDCYINETVVSEFLFHFLKINSDRAPLSLKEAGKIKEVFAGSDTFQLLQLFHFLPSTPEIISLVPALMSKFNLLPNDAIIIATCKINGVKFLASYDSDLKTPCEDEGIIVLTETEIEY